MLLGFMLQMGYSNVHKKHNFEISILNIGVSPWQKKYHKVCEVWLVYKTWNLKISYLIASFSNLSRSLGFIVGSWPEWTSLIPRLTKPVLGDSVAMSKVSNNCIIWCIFCDWSRIPWIQAWDVIAIEQICQTIVFNKENATTKHGCCKHDSVGILNKF